MVNDQSQYQGAWKEWGLTNSLSHRRHIPNTILMNLHLSSQTLAIQRRPHKCFSHLNRPAILEFNKVVLLDDVRHFLLLLFTLVGFLLQIGDLLVNVIEAMPIRRAI